MAGRKPLWDELDMPSKLDSVKGWAMQGSTDEEMCQMLGISHDTFYKWKNDKAEFAEAIKKGKYISNGELINSAFKQAMGYRYTEQQAIKVAKGRFQEEIQIVEVERFAPPNATMTIFMMKNRLPEGYKDKIQAEVENNGKVEVFLNVPQPKPEG